MNAALERTRTGHMSKGGPSPVDPHRTIAHSTQARLDLYAFVLFLALTALANLPKHGCKNKPKRLSPSRLRRTSPPILPAAHPWAAAASRG